jgi:HEAT repeat protein
MKRLLCSLCAVTALTFALVGAAPSSYAGKEKTEDELIQDLSHAKDSVVRSAMQQLEKRFPNSPKALPLLKAALADPRPPVRRKAARVLGVWHVQLEADELKHIYAMLRVNERDETCDALKALGDMRAKVAVPEILPCLKSDNPFIVRDACRALALIGDKSVIPHIEPLLTSADPKIKKDAEDAIFKLK